MPVGRGADMALRDQLTDDLKVAMRAGDSTRRDAIRLIRSALQAEEARRRDEAYDAWEKQIKRAGGDPATAEFTPPPPLDEAQIVQVLNRQAKQRRDSIEAYQKADRADLVA